VPDRVGRATRRAGAHGGYATQWGLKVSVSGRTFLLDEEETTAVVEELRLLAREGALLDATGARRAIQDALPVRAALVAGSLTVAQLLALARALDHVERICAFSPEFGWTCEAVRAKLGFPRRVYALNDRSTGAILTFHSYTGAYEAGDRIVVHAAAFRVVAARPLTSGFPELLVCIPAHDAELGEPRFDTAA
jgi:hypothetical protein